MDILKFFSTFAVEIIKTITPKSWKGNKVMTKELTLVSANSIEKAFNGMNELLADLKEELGENRFQSEVYVTMLKVSSLIDSEFFRREREKSNI